MPSLARPITGRGSRTRGRGGYAPAKATTGRNRGKPSDKEAPRLGESDAAAPGAAPHHKDARGQRLSPPRRGTVGDDRTQDGAGYARARNPRTHGLWRTLTAHERPGSPTPHCTGTSNSDRAEKLQPNCPGNGRGGSAPAPNTHCDTRRKRGGFAPAQDIEAFETEAGFSECRKFCFI